MDAMQSEALDRIDAAAIALVANDRMSAFGEMDANLMLSAGLQPDLEKRCPRISFEDANVSDRKFTGPCVLRGINAKRAILGKVRFDSELVRAHASFHDCDVLPAGTEIGRASCRERVYVLV